MPTTTWVAAAGKPPRLTVNGAPFFARGVCYAPVPWGANPNWPPHGDFMFPPWNEIWQRDLKAMQAAGINCLRTYNIQSTAPNGGAIQDHTQFFNDCWNAGPVYVLVGCGPLNNVGLYDPWDGNGKEEVRAKAAAGFLDTVKAYASFPAVMGFIIGNEVNNASTRDNPLFWNWLNELAGRVKKAAPDKITLMALVDDSMLSPNAGNALMPNLDVWGINTYRGRADVPASNNFDNLWSSYAAASAKPLLLTEWGAPASTHDADGQLAFTPEVMSVLQTYVAGHYRDIAFDAVTTTDNGGDANPNAQNWAPVCAGSAYFEWTDEWWKMDAAYPNEKCAATVHNPGIGRNDAYPGGWDDEECFGLNGIEPAGTDPIPSERPGPPPSGGCPGPWNFAANAPYPPDTLKPRGSLGTLSALWKG